MKIYIWVLIIIVALGGVYYYSTNKEKIVRVGENTMCFAYTSEGDGIKDVYSLSLDVKGEKAEGQLNFMPREKDSKTGPFEGLVSPTGADGISRVVAAWWNASGEGVTNREQLAILLSGEMANIGFGEMIENADGDYIYANPAEVSYSLGLAKVDCQADL